MINPVETTITFQSDDKYVTLWTNSRAMKSELKRKGYAEVRVFPGRFYVPKNNLKIRILKTGKVVGKAK